MKLFRLILCVLFFCVFQHGFALSHDDEEKITSIIQEYVDAWNHSSGRGFADNFCSDSDFINIFGMHFHGKEAIQNRHNEIHDTFLKHSTFTITNLEVREINPNLAMVFVRWNVERVHKPETGRNELGETIKGIFSHVFIKDDGSWKIAATQNTLSK